MSGGFGGGFGGRNGYGGGGYGQPNPYRFGMPGGNMQGVQRTGGEMTVNPIAPPSYANRYGPDQHQPDRGTPNTISPLPMIDGRPSHMAGAPFSVNPTNGYGPDQHQPGRGTPNTTSPLPLIDGRPPHMAAAPWQMPGQSGQPVMSTGLNRAPVQPPSFMTGGNMQSTGGESNVQPTGYPANNGPADPYAAINAQRAKMGAGPWMGAAAQQHYASQGGVDAYMAKMGMPPQGQPGQPGQPPGQPGQQPGPQSAPWQPPGWESPQNTYLAGPTAGFLGLSNGPPPDPRMMWHQQSGQYQLVPGFNGYKG